VEKRIEMIDMKPEDFVYISDMENSMTTKPHKEYFENILKELDISPEEAIIIGDTDFDKAAEKVGIKFIHVDDIEEWKKIIED
jgi:FMN phosphatase YigB (HAD superfamily)